MVALTGGDLTGTSARVRAKHADGSWGPWYDAETWNPTASDDGPRPPTDPAAPIRCSSGRTTAVQIAVTRPPSAPVTDRRARRPTEARPGLRPGQRRTATGAEPLGGTDLPAAGAGRRPVDAAHRGAGARASRPTSSAARSGAPTSRCDAATRCTTTACAPRSCTTPRAATTTRPRIPRRSCGRSTRTTPAPSAGATSPTTRWSTSTARSSRAAPAASTRPVEGSHTGGFNRDTWGVAMLGDFDDVPPTQIQLRTVGRLLGWRLGMDHVDPKGTVALTSAGGSLHQLPARRHADAADHLHPPRRRQHRLPRQRRLRRDGRNPGYRRTFQRSAGPADAGGHAAGRRDLRQVAGDGRPTTARWARRHRPRPPATATRATPPSTRARCTGRPDSGAEPVTGAIYDAWASLGYERGLLGLPTSGEIQEPQWVVQNFQHGTLNFDRETGMVTRVVDGVAQELPPPPPSGPPVQLERFTPIDSRLTLGSSPARATSVRAPAPPRRRCWARSPRRRRRSPRDARCPSPRRDRPSAASARRWACRRTR